MIELIHTSTHQKMATMKLFQLRDGTAQGVAKARHYEELWPEGRRLFTDRYARRMYPGSFVQTWSGTSALKWMYDKMMGVGVLELLLIRTKWMDDEIMKRTTVDVSANGSVGGNDDDGGQQFRQLIILGAGYDTRGFRLGLQQQQQQQHQQEGPPNFQVWEVDQPEVQSKKVKIMEQIADGDEQVSKILSDQSVKFVPIDFNIDSLDETFKKTDGFIVGQKSIVTLEGVSQYVPKDALADTLTKLHDVVSTGSILLMSYVDQNIIDDPTKIGGPISSTKMLLKMAKMVGEPWISFWTKEGFEEWMKNLGYEVMENTTTKDYNEKYMEPLDRRMEPESIVSVERYVVAKVL